MSTKCSSTFFFLISQSCGTAFQIFKIFKHFFPKSSKLIFKHFWKVFKSFLIYLHRNQVFEIYQGSARIFRNCLGTFDCSSDVLNNAIEHKFLKATKCTAVSENSIVGFVKMFKRLQVLWRLKLSSLFIHISRHEFSQRNLTRFPC